MEKPKNNGSGMVIVTETQHQRLRQVRNYLDIRQGPFAEQISMTQGALSDIERGKVKISTSVIEKMAGAFDINPNYIILGIGPFFLKDLNSFTIKFNSKGEVQWEGI
tara:strand:+ start:153 stop:473 length:321 start_codon:yes stop_codon:yes gene_type:complete